MGGEILGLLQGFLSLLRRWRWVWLALVLLGVGYVICGRAWW
jgi:hypothetical protein